jgi:hypothetical protein
MATIDSECGYIQSMIQNDMYIITKHAQLRMRERDIDDIMEIVVNGTYKHAKYDPAKGESPRYLFSYDGENVIIALGGNNPLPGIITVYKEGDKNEVL